MLTFARRDPGARGRHDRRPAARAARATCTRAPSSSSRCSPPGLRGLFERGARRRRDDIARHATGTPPNAGTARWPRCCPPSDILFVNAGRAAAPAVARWPPATRSDAATALAARGPLPVVKRGADGALAWARRRPLVHAAATVRPSSTPSAPATASTRASSAAGSAAGRSADSLAPRPSPAARSRCGGGGVDRGSRRSPRPRRHGRLVTRPRADAECRRRPRSGRRAASATARLASCRREPAPATASASPSVCSAEPFVLDAALRHARATRRLALASSRPPTRSTRTAATRA